MVDLLLIFPYFNDDSSPLKFPPLGLGYIASYVRQHGYSVKIIDCTFRKWQDALSEARGSHARVIGVHSMLTMKEPSLRFADELRERCELLIAGGPLPTVYPEQFAEHFDLVCMGEAEETALELMETFERRKEFERVRGLAYKRQPNGHPQTSGGLLGHDLASNSELHFTPPRERVANLDSLPFPARDLFEHEAYKGFYRTYHKEYCMTSLMASRGCPFDCAFCSRPVFGRFYRARSPPNIVDELEVIKQYGYTRAWFADDIFPVNRRHLHQVCDEIISRGLDIEWECLCRADLMDEELARRMRRAGCVRVFMGLESGDDKVLEMMNKQLTVAESVSAVRALRGAGVKVGAFFILGWPGETNETMLKTISMASSLPLDYFSITVPYPIPGTKLYESLRGRMVMDEWVKPKSGSVDQKLIWASDHSEEKLRFGIKKARWQAGLRRSLGQGYLLFGKPFELITDEIFRAKS